MLSSWLLVASIRLWRRRAHRKCLARIERLERELLPHLFPSPPRSVKASDVVYVGLTSAQRRSLRTGGGEFVSYPRAYARHPVPTAGTASVTWDSCHLCAATGMWRAEVCPLCTYEHAHVTRGTAQMYEYAPLNGDHA